MVAPRRLRRGYRRSVDCECSWHGVVEVVVMCEEGAELDCDVLSMEGGRVDQMERFRRPLGSDNNPSYFVFVFVFLLRQHNDDCRRIETIPFYSAAIKCYRCLLDNSSILFSMVLYCVQAKISHFS